MLKTYTEVLDKAHALLSERHPRAKYAHAVLDGKRRWSGADLPENHNWTSYARQRKRARKAWRDAGGLLIHGPRRLLVAVVPSGDPSAPYLDAYGTTYRRGPGLCWIAEPSA